MAKSFELEFFTKDGKVYVNASIVENRKSKLISGSINKPEIQNLLEEFELNSKYANEVE